MLLKPTAFYAHYFYDYLCNHASLQNTPIVNKKILSLAIPNIISNITVPLLGLVDIAIVGHLGDERYIGAIAIGSMIFSIIYWNFGFLRMGTSGFTAQAYGKRDLSECTNILVRASCVGLSIATLLLLLHIPIVNLIFHFLQAGELVKDYALSYFKIVIWGAPAVLMLYGLKGWFIGMQNARIPMCIAIVVNCVNILASLFFVYVLEMKIEGIALGTLVAEYTGLLIALALWVRYYGRLSKRINIKQSLRLEKMKQFFSLNGYIFLRTLCLVCVTSFFTSSGANRSDVILAVNTLLMQLFTLYSYFMDGFAYAAEALVGRYIGAKDQYNLRKSVSYTFRWGWILSFIFTLLYMTGGANFLSLLTNNQEVLEAAIPFSYWAMAVPIVGFAAFLWDGIFIGATAGKEMSIAMMIATTSFFVIYFALDPFFGNHALWVAFLSYLSLRGITQYLWFNTTLKYRLTI